MRDDIPHGHGRSFKRGIADSLLDENNNDYNGNYQPADVPYGHEHSYRRGREEGDSLRKQIAERVKPNVSRP